MCTFSFSNYSEKIKAAYGMRMCAVVRTMEYEMRSQSLTRFKISVVSHSLIYVKMITFDNKDPFPDAYGPLLKLISINVYDFHLNRLTLS